MSFAASVVMESRSRQQCSVSERWDCISIILVNREFNVIQSVGFPEKVGAFSLIPCVLTGAGISIAVVGPLDGVLECSSASRAHYLEDCDIILRLNTDNTSSLA